jgi:hypothetical protein
LQDEPNDDNWLHAEVFPCPPCQQALYRVDHSPFYDEYRLYCDRCANSVEVSYYDPVTTAFTERVRGEGMLVPGWEQTTAVLRLIEQRLKPCACGGWYHYDAPRRCPFCLAPALTDEPWVDLWPGYFGVDEDNEPSSEQTAQYEAYWNRHVRERDLRRDG